MRPFGSVEQRGDGKWLCRWRDVRGVRRSHMVTGTERDARLYLARMEMERDGADRSVTYSAYWDSFVDPQIDRLADKTAHEYRRLWERELKPAIGSRIVATTSHRFAQSVIDAIAAPSVQRAAARLWSKVCNMAVRDGILDSNPVQRLQFAAHEKRPKTIIPAASVLPFARAAMDSPLAHLALLELCAGLRHEEACAVTAEDVARMPFGASVTVSKARVTVNGRMVEKGVKNACSARTVPIAGECAELLLACDIRPQHPEHASKAWRRRGGLHIPFGHMRSNFATHAGECCDGALVDVYMGHSGRSTMDAWYRARTDAGMLMVAEAYAGYVSSATSQPPAFTVSAGGIA